MPASFETHATASHRYYMRKTKAEVVRRIRDLLDQIPMEMVRELARIKTDKAPFPNDPTRALYFIACAHDQQDGFAVSECVRTHPKAVLASAAMLAHDLLEKVQAMPELDSCAADDDDMCVHPKCPQNRDGEPTKTGRHCPLHDPAWRDGDEG